MDPKQNNGCKAQYLSAIWQIMRLDKNIKDNANVKVNEIREKKN